MASVSLPYNLTAGSPENVANLMSNLNALKDGVNTIDTAQIASGAVTTAKLASAVGNFGAWTPYEPLLYQSGTIAKSIQLARWTKIGRMIVGHVMVTATATGTSGVKVEIGMPDYPESASQICGHGLFYDSDAGKVYVVEAIWSNTASALASLSADQTNGSQVGVDPALALGNNDQVRLSFTYETSS